MIDRKTYADRFPHKKKVVNYKCCIAERFNEFYPGDAVAGAAPVAADADARTGIVMRLTIFDDEALTKPIEYREVFQHRKYGTTPPSFPLATGD